VMRNHDIIEMGPLDGIAPIQGDPRDQFGA